MKHTEQMWGLVNATMRGKPLLLPNSIRRTKREVRVFRAEYPFRVGFTIVRVTVTFTDPREAR